MKRLQDMTEPELRDLLNACARAINSKLSAVCGADKPMFALVVFNDPAVAQYISSCQRKDMIKAMRETADRLEFREDVPRD